MNLSKKRITKDESYKIQLLRGIAILAVVFIHNTPAGITQVWCRPLINFAVGLFLFISGFLSSYSNWNPVSRIKKVIIPYIIWTGIYSVLYNLSSPSSIPADFAKYLILGKAAPVMYYIFVYCQLTLLIPLIDRLGKSKYKYLGLLISPAEIIIMRLIPLLLNYEVNYIIQLIMDISCLGWFSYFYIGYLINNKYIEVKIRNKKLILLWIGAVIIQIIEGYFYFNKGVDNCGTQLKLSALLTGAISCLIAYNFIIAKENLKIQWLYVLGNNSFGIYFSHIAIMRLLAHIPYYNQIMIYPFNAVFVTFISLILVIAGKKILGKWAKYLAL